MKIFLNVSPDANFDDTMNISTKEYKMLQVISPQQIETANRLARVAGRRLVTVRRIDAIDDIPNADVIKVASIGGWKVVVKAGEFQPGDHCVFFEIDAFLPAADSRFAFLKKSKITWQRLEGYRLRTIRLRKQLSQGLTLPLHLFPEISESLPADYESADFTELLKVDKWEAYIHESLVGMCRGNFPLFISKTSAERCQNLGREIFEKFNTQKYEVTTKLDGSSITAYSTHARFQDDEEFRVGVCSRNFDLKLDQEGNAFVSLAKKCGVLDVLGVIKKNVAIQGEMLAPGVQNNRENVPYAQFHVFSIFDINTGAYLEPEARQEYFTQLQYVAQANNIPLEIYHVPVLHYNVTLSELGITNMEQLLQFAEGPSLTHPQREGVVFKAMDRDFSFKVIANSYLENER